MGLERVIVRQVVKVAKDTGKLENSLSNMEIKLKAEGLKVLNSTGLNPSVLPFDPVALIDGKIENPSKFLTPQIICDLPPLSEAQKQKALKIVDSTLISINNIIDNKNKISSALQIIKAPLIALDTTASTLNGIITTVKVAVKVIKAIPIPTAIIPPTGGIGLPINILTILSDSLDQLDKLLTMGKGITKLVPPLTREVIKMISTTISKLNGLDRILTPVITTLAFTKVIAELGDTCGVRSDPGFPKLTNDAINVVNDALVAEILESIATSGNSSSTADNLSSENELKDALSPSANPGVIYQGFRLILQNNPNNGFFETIYVDEKGVTLEVPIEVFNEFSFPSRRIQATRDFSKEGNTTYKTKYDKFTTLATVTIYNDPGAQARYSYSATAQVLYEEMKFKIDNYVRDLRVNIKLDEAVREESRDSSTSGTASGIYQNLASSGSNTPFQPYVLNGPNIVKPQSINSGGEVTGTIVVNVPIKVTMTTNGGFGSSTFTNTILQFQKGNKPINAASAIEQYVVGYGNDQSLPIQLPETGIWNYSMKMVGNYGINQNQSSFAIELM